MFSHIKVIYASIIIVFQLLFGFAQAVSPPVITVVPKPAFMQMTHGEFKLNQACRILLRYADPNLTANAEYFKTIVAKSTGYELEIIHQTDDMNNAILFELSKEFQHLGQEGYELKVTKQGVSIKSQTTTGNFYALQTLRQMLPADIESKKVIKRLWTIPCCRIIDNPSFGWRGMHMDVCRHFFDKQFILKYLDTLAIYKINKFHWHLTDDEAWRIQIDKYPKLTEIGAWRGPANDRYGGFYSKEDVKEIIEYARKRYIMIVPEIEMPGHCNAAIYSYPELSCGGKIHATGDDNSMSYFLKEGRFAFCAGKEQTFSFLEDVLSEVQDLFPSPYIHIGGDERPEAVWDNCELCRKRMKDNGIDNAEKLQQYFISRIEQYLNSKGRRLIGWDQITSKTLEKSSIVISYQGTAPAIQSARTGNDVILAPNVNCYFDYYQSNPPDEPEAIGGLVTLKSVYSLNPKLSNLTTKQQKHILGAEACLWTEFIKTDKHAEYMTFPRICALAEVVWTPANKKNWGDFENRITAHYERFDRLGVNYRRYRSKNVFEPESTTSGL